MLNEDRTCKKKGKWLVSQAEIFVGFALVVALLVSVIYTGFASSIQEHLNDRAVPPAKPGDLFIIPKGGETLGSS
ncbi:hypothetical protein O3V59_08565 [Brevibacillus thermoruber]|uniref:Uncharacterized protein n=1 Tax=Brevibacillus thermoruber TaxID=33942 RepID=A0A9X3TPI3_9BACL|nr:hypothetical protein [Brevibacillus thermoruber]MDA5108412.1 hypothetical protein [Brevibacillus thermoruber]